MEKLNLKYCKKEIVENYFSHILLEPIISKAP